MAVHWRLACLLLAALCGCSFLHGGIHLMGNYDNCSRLQSAVQKAATQRSSPPHIDWNSSSSDLSRVSSVFVTAWTRWLCLQADQRTAPHVNERSGTLASQTAPTRLTTHHGDCYTHRGLDRSSMESHSALVLRGGEPRKWEQWACTSFARSIVVQLAASSEATRAFALATRIALNPPAPLVHTASCHAVLPGCAFCPAAAAVPPQTGLVATGLWISIVCAIVVSRSTLCGSSAEPIAAVKQALWLAVMVGTIIISNATATQAQSQITHKQRIGQRSVQSLHSCVLLIMLYVVLMLVTRICCAIKIFVRRCVHLCFRFRRS
jgi:hypothetical protein